MKIAKVLFGVLCLLSATLGGVGFYYSKKTPEEVKYTIDYIYYIDGAVVESMPGNIGSYVFDNYYCTNKVTGEWNESEWTFTPNLIDNSNCTLYFKTKTFEVNVAFNGAKNTDETYEGTSIVKKGESLEFTIEPEEGYGYSNVECTNQEQGSFSEESNKVVIGPFNGASKCNVNFKLNTYSVKLETTNGTPGSKSVNVSYGEDATIEVSPTENYSFDSVKCTPTFDASWKDDELVISKVTSDVSCKLKFKLQSYKVEVSVENGTVDTESKKVAFGKGETFTITPDDGFTLDGAEVTCKGAEGELNNAKLKVSSVVKDATCTVKLSEKPEEIEESNEDNEE